MDLILWRHADAHEPADGQDDAERALTAKGERQAARMAQWLQRHLPESTRVLASPTRRTRQTADALQGKYKVMPELAPDGTVEALLHATRWPDGRGPVLVVGHQPTLGLVAAYLLSGTTAPLAVRKGAVWWLRRRTRGEQVDVVLQAVVAPDLV
ncbi:MAG: phosphohistidine phosphatase SixA [Rubrivivax sp.]